MDEHDSRFFAILQNSALAGLYTKEVRSLAVGFAHHARELMGAVPMDDQTTFMTVEPVLKQHTHSLLASAGRLNQLRFTDGKRRKGESLKKFEFRERRSKWLREYLLSGIDLTPLGRPWAL